MTPLLTPQRARLRVLRQEVLRERHAKLLDGAPLDLLLGNPIHLGCESQSGSALVLRQRRTVFLMVSVAVMSLLSPRRYAGAMSLSSSTSHCHSTAWCTVPSRHTRATRTRDLPCACLARCMAAQHRHSAQQHLGRASAVSPRATSRAPPQAAQEPGGAHPHGPALLNWLRRRRGFACGSGPIRAARRPR